MATKLFYVLFFFPSIFLAWRFWETFRWGSRDVVSRSMYIVWGRNQTVLRWEGEFCRRIVEEVTKSYEEVGILESPKLRACCFERVSVFVTSTSYLLTKGPVFQDWRWVVKVVESCREPGRSPYKHFKAFQIVKRGI